MTPFNQQTMDKLEELRKIHEALSPKEKAHWKEEGRKCLESPLYYYNNYWRKKSDPELTQEEFDFQIHKAELERIMSRNRQRFNFTTDMLEFKFTKK